MTGDGATLTDDRAMHAIPVVGNSRIKAAWANNALVSELYARSLTAWHAAAAACQGRGRTRRAEWPPGPVVAEFAELVRPDTAAPFILAGAGRRDFCLMARKTMFGLALGRATSRGRPLDHEGAVRARQAKVDP